MAAEFTIGDYSFQVANLKVKTSLLVFKRLAKTLLPAIAEAQAAPEGEIGNAVQRVVENLDSLDDLFDAFVPATQATWPQRPNMTPLNTALAEHVFGGRPELLLEYFARCVQGEYGAFLKEDGPLGAMVTRAKAGMAAAPTAAKS